MSKRSSPPPSVCLAGPSSLQRRQELQHLRCDCIVEDQLWSSCPSSWARHNSQFTGQHFPARWYQTLPCFPHVTYVISAAECAAAPVSIPGPYLFFVNTQFPLQGFLPTPGNQLRLPGNDECFLKASESTEARTLLKSESPCLLFDPVYCIRLFNTTTL